MALTAILLRAILESVWTDIQRNPGTAITLQDGLEAFRTARFDEGTEGRFLVGTTSRHQSVTFANPAPGSASPADYLTAAQFLLEMMRRIKAALGGTPTDQQIVDAMLAEMVPIRRLARDFTLMRK